MGLSIYTFTVDCSDPDRVARFWAAALGWEETYRDDDEIAIEPVGDGQPALLFGRAPDVKAGKNRLHLDLNPDDQEAEVRRLKELGATEVDIGQGEQTWVVLADPEGNEFCILTPR